MLQICNDVFIFANVLKNILKIFIHNVFNNAKLMKKQNQETRGFVREVERMINAGAIKSYRQLADMTGINYTTLSIVMNGKRDLPVEHFASFEKVFKIDKSQLYNIGAELKILENNIQNHNYISNEKPPQVVNEKEVEYLKQIIKAKDDLIEMLKKQIEK